MINPGKGPDDPAWQTGRNYQLFRAMLASNRSGEFPTLFNGGPFTCEPDPDFRNWFDCQFMAQNQRLVYWPMLKSGDFDLLKVGLEYYRRHTALQEAWAKHFWKVDGLAFHEGMGIYGTDWAPNPEGHGGPAHLTYHKISGMEFALMMLDSGQLRRGRCPALSADRVGLSEILRPVLSAQKTRSEPARNWMTTAAWSSSPAMPSRCIRKRAMTPAPFPG